MKAQRFSYAARAIAAIVLLGLPLAIQAHHGSDEALAVPGFRPDSEHAATFISELDQRGHAVSNTVRLQTGEVVRNQLR